jgi:hypothetical protein
MKNLKEIILVICFFIFNGFSVLATHQISGQITYKHISGNTYEITITTYTYSPSPADRPELPIKWGDGYSGILPRVLKQEITNLIRKNVYVGWHSFSGEGIYYISFEDPNRNYGIVNIPNSVNVPMYVESKLIIDYSLGPNNSPLLLSDIFVIGDVNKIVTYNQGAYDADGDSLAYKLSICKGGGGLPIPGYSMPDASNVIGIYPTTGDFLWDSPVLY